MNLESTVFDLRTLNERLTSELENTKSASAKVEEERVRADVEA